MRPPLNTNGDKRGLKTDAALQEVTYGIRQRRQNLMDHGLS